MDFSISVRAYACSQSDPRPRLQIEAILFRASAMLQDDKHMVLGIKDGTIILPVPSLSGSRIREFSGVVCHNAFVVGSAEECKSS